MYALKREKDPFPDLMIFVCLFFFSRSLPQLSIRYDIGRVQAVTGLFSISKNTLHK